MRDTPADFLRGLAGVRTTQIHPTRLFKAAGFQASEQIREATRDANAILGTNAPPEVKAAVRRQLFEKKREIRTGLREKLSGAR